MARRPGMRMRSPRSTGGQLPMIRGVGGVVVHYRHQLLGTTAHRGKTTYAMPLRWAERTKVVEVPQGATDIRLTDTLPEEPLMGVT